ncbi:MAG: bacteriochlorophyll 4-vinyl reductase [Proteobacteria bacterium]|nr:bacteriochlorophyll 4-vinyl reductase [Pseudomonadota bacterium]
MTVLPAAGTIGPNAIIRVIESLAEIEGPPSVRRIFAACGLEAYLARQPTGMVDEAEVIRLHRVLHDDLGDDGARRVARLAGERTAVYLLGHRIPRPAQLVLRHCPAGLASRLLARAIARNAWTFAGTGSFSARHGRPTVFTIRNCPVCRQERGTTPRCDYYAATFETLYRALVHPRARVGILACVATGADACRFAIDWS